MRQSERSYLADVFQMVQEAPDYPPFRPAIPSFPDGLPQQLEDRGSDSWCSRHGRIPWAADGICGACECEMDAEELGRLLHIEGEDTYRTNDQGRVIAEDGAVIEPDEEDCLF